MAISITDMSFSPRHAESKQESFAVTRWSHFVGHCHRAKSGLY